MRGSQAAAQDPRIVSEKIYHLTATCKTPVRRRGGQGMDK